MKRLFIGLMLTLAAASSHAATVLPNGSLFDLGSFAAGTYLLTGSGTIDLCGSGGTFTMQPNGTPDSAVTCGGYGATFNPDGAYSADGNFARAGLNAKIGALIGTLNAGAYTGLNPTTAQAADWFLIGYSAVVTLSAAGHIYASVNDTYYPNDVGAFNVTVRAVPEPEAYALTLVGLGLLAFTARRRRLKTAPA